MSKAIELAKECGLIGEWSPWYKQYEMFAIDNPSEDIERAIDAFFRRAQAMALREAAPHCGWELGERDSAYYLNKLADELEAGK